MGELDHSGQCRRLPHEILHMVDGGLRCSDESGEPLCSRGIVALGNNDRCTGTIGVRRAGHRKPIQCRYNGDRLDRSGRVRGGDRGCSESRRSILDAQTRALGRRSGDRVRGEFGRRVRPGEFDVQSVSGSCTSRAPPWAWAAGGNSHDRRANPFSVGTSFGIRSISCRESIVSN